MELVAAKDTTPITTEPSARAHGRPLQLLSLTILLSGAVWYAMYLKYSVLDLDIWWHLKVGDWIVQHLAVPRTGIFSATAGDRPWVAYSWGYEVLLSRAYAWFGLSGVGFFGVLLTFAVAYTVFWMLRRISGSFWLASCLGFIACSAFLYTLMPRPVFFSMILFMATLTLIFEAQRDGRIQLLYWLPLVFVLWANLHIQFLYGLFLVGLLLAVNLAHDLMDATKFKPEWLAPARLSTKSVALVFAGCVLSTCIGPYSFHLYRVAYEYSQAKATYALIQELRPINFRFVCHYVQLLLTGSAFFAIGRQKKIDLFKLSLLTICSVVAYRTMRDSWFICVPAAACIADSFRKDTDPVRGERWYEALAVFAGVIVLAALFVRNTGFTTRDLDAAISSELPVKAVNFLRRNPTPGPLYNPLDWGGFLIWYMPDHPVAIDGRNDLYGDEMDLQFFRTIQADSSYQNDPYLNQAGTLLLQKRLPLVGVLRTDPNYQLVYEDDLAVIFVRRSAFWQR